MHCFSPPSGVPRKLIFGIQPYSSPTKLFSQKRMKSPDPLVNYVKNTMYYRVELIIVMASVLLKPPGPLASDPSELYNNCFQSLYFDDLLSALKCFVMGR